MFRELPKFTFLLNINREYIFYVHKYRIQKNSIYTRRTKYNSITGMKLVQIHNFLDSYKRFSYILGRQFDKSPSQSIAKLLYQSDLEMTAGMFTSLWVVTTLLCTGITAAVSAVIFGAPFSPVHSNTPLIFILGLTGTVAAGVGIGFPFFLQNKISNKKRDIESQLPYALAFMSILASSGSTPLEIIRRLAIEDYGHVSNEFKKVLFRVEILGEDAVTAMNALMNNTPSEQFRDICIDMTNIIYGGGGFKQYLEAKSKDLMSMRRQAYKEFVESLAVFGEGYLGGIIMLITLSVLGIVISGALGIELGPFKPSEMWFYLIYLVTPLVNIVFLQVLGVKYSTNP